MGSLASKGSAAEQIVTDGGVDVTIHAMEAHPSSASCARAGIEVFRILRDTHPDKLRALGSSAQSVASAIVGSLSSYNDNDGRSSTLSVGGGNDGTVSAMHVKGNVVVHSTELEVTASGLINGEGQSVERRGNGHKNKNYGGAHAGQGGGYANQDGAWSKPPIRDSGPNVWSGASLWDNQLLQHRAETISVQNIHKQQ